MKLKMELTSHIPVILISSENRDEVELESYKHGANDFIAKPFEPLVLQQKINALLSTISSSGEHKESGAEQIFDLPDSSDDVIITKIFDLINENFANPEYSVEVIATKLGLSRSQLWRKTKNSIDKTPLEVIRDIRLKKAAEMLKTNKFRVSEIAYQVGYNDPRVFQRNFSKCFGLSPSDFAKKHSS